MSKQDRIQEANKVMQNTRNTKALKRAKTYFDMGPSAARLKMLRAVAGEIYKSDHRHEIERQY